MINVEQMKGPHPNQRAKASRTAIIVAATAVAVYIGIFVVTWLMGH
ncbi:MAG TPA: hypothetical protein VFL45_06240 [Gammaproteobacteria bacterium]|nr:hypothetical protein [Gammaproteobacteria bacterium]